MANFLKPDPKAKYEALDKMAAQAMQGLVSRMPSDTDKIMVDALAEHSYDIAEAMLREREKRIEKEFGK